MDKLKSIILGILLAITILAPLPTHAEEGGSGHYMPGGAASFVDALPGKPGLAIANYFTYYDASVSLSRQLPFGGLITAGLDATVYADTVMALYQTPLKLLVLSTCSISAARSTTQTSDWSRRGLTQISHGSVVV